MTPQKALRYLIQRNPIPRKATGERLIITIKKVIHKGIDLAVNRREIGSLTITDDKSNMMVKVACAYFGSVQVLFLEHNEEMEKKRIEILIVCSTS